MTTSRRLVAMMLFCFASLPAAAAETAAKTVARARKLLDANKFTEAVKLAEPLAKEGDVKAQVLLGDLYYHWKQTTTDTTPTYEKAVSWYTKAADKGDHAAELGLGAYYWSIKGDYPAAISWLEKSAAGGNANALYNLGHAHTVGKGVPLDPKRSVELFTKAANKGYVRAMMRLGMVHENGQGVPQDMAKAARWYLKAARKGDVSAQMRLVGIYGDGESGVKQDNAEAYKWALISEKQAGPNPLTDNQKSILEQRLTPDQIADAKRLAAGR